MLQLATGHAAGRSGTAIEEFGSDRAFKFVIDYTSGSELSPRLAGCSLCAKHGRQLGGGSLLASLMVVAVSTLIFWQRGPRRRPAKAGGAVPRTRPAAPVFNSRCPRGETVHECSSAGRLELVTAQGRHVGP